MKHLVFTCFASSTLALSMPAHAQETACPAGGDWAIAIHGGAGVILRENMDAETEGAYRQSLNWTLAAGAEILRTGGTAMDAAEAMIIRMENDPKYNAGKGAVFTAKGENEMDAAVMDGRTRNAGAITGVRTVRNPITLARSVMENSRHVMLSGEGAEVFAAEQNIDRVEPGYFYTERRWQQLQNRLTKKESALPKAIKFGTVGAVVRDGCGDLAAGTSTGGLTAKEWGRIGDTPIIGAGTYADNDYCAVSATGTGEFFIRGTIARDVCARIRFAGESLIDATDNVILDDLTKLGGDGGIISMGPDGFGHWAFNTPGMYRARVSEDRDPEIYIFGD